MIKLLKYIQVFFFGLLIIITASCSYSNFDADNNITEVTVYPGLDPDYINVEIPPNIAPLNFIIEEQGTEYYVKIYSINEEPIEIYSTESKINIPMNQWKNILTKNTGNELTFDIYVKGDNENWKKYKSITNSISKDPIDSHIAYRLIMPAYNYWNEIGIYQRNLENFDESPIILNKLTGKSCINCHNFRANDPDNMVLHLRAGDASGTLLIKDGKAKKINTSTDFNKAGAYPSWHPNGNLIAFSSNNLILFFHAKGVARDVLDKGSDIIVYDIEKNMITTTPQISGPERMENFPWWSPDGKYLYYSSAPGFKTYMSDINGESYLDFNNIQYDLMRIPYDEKTGEWGHAETVLSAEITGLTILEPRISPDGRYALVTMGKYGNFPIYLTDSDVYLIDLNTFEYRRLECNSDDSDSFHSWSSSGRWFSFASKRRDGILGRIYFSHFDENGNISKPFLMPQKDPSTNNTFFKNYNVPELIKGPVKVSAQELARVAFDNENMLKAQLDPKVQARIKNNELEERKQNQDKPDHFYSQQ